MWDCEAALRELARCIEPTPAQKSRASRSQNHLKALLQEGSFGDRIIDAYLSGSYARDTAVTPIDDVDIIVIVDPAGWRRPFWTTHPPPARILESFARAIRYRYPRSPVYVQRRSVRLELWHLKFDVVPAIELAEKPHHIRIPDRDADEWLTSAPRLHTAIATEVNRTSEGRFKPVVKMLKYWNAQLPATARLKSFAIETLAATLFRNVPLPSLQEGCRLFFDFVAARGDEGVLYRWRESYGIHMSAWAHEIFDLAGTGSNLLARVTRAQRKKFIEHAVRSRDRLILAERARTRDSAIDHLGKALRMRVNRSY